MDQSGKNRHHSLVNNGGFGIFLHGLILGWLRFPYQFDSVACGRFNGHWPLFASHLCCIQHPILCWNNPLDANFVRWLSTGSKFRTYVGKFSIFRFVFFFVTNNLSNDEILFDRKSMKHA